MIVRSHARRTPLPIGLSVDSNEHWEHIHFHTLSYYTGLKVVSFMVVITLILML